MIQGNLQPTSPTLRSPWRTRLAIASAFAAAMSVAPTFILSMSSAILILGTIGFAGAWCVDRFGDLPGCDRHCR